MDETLEKLYRQPLLDPLEEEDLEQVRAVVYTRVYQANEAVFRQGDEAKDFYMVSAGEFEVLYEDERGEHRINLLYPSEFFGDVALFEGTPRGVTVRALMDSEVLFIPKEDFFRLLDEYPELERSLAYHGHEIEERTHRTFEGQHEDEVIIYFHRRHWISLAKRAGRVTVAGLLWVIALVLAYYFFRDNPAAQTQAAIILLMALLIPLALAAWEFIDWYNDYHILTNERIIHVEKVVGLMNERFEAPLNKIQNVNVAQSTPIAELLGYGTLIIATAAQGGKDSTIVLHDIQHPHIFAERIIQELNREKNVIVEQEREERRRVLRTALGLEPEPEPGPDEDQRSTPSGHGPRQSGMFQAFSRIVRYLSPITREQRGSTIVWRKHWIILLASSLPAYLLLLALLAGGGALLFYELPLPAETGPITWWLVGLLFIFDLLWLIWLYLDWRNDLYILTPDAILDEEKHPLGFNKEVRRAPLDTIQDIRYVQGNPLMVGLGVGHVLIQTAGTQGEFTFDWVKDPQAVQYDIFQYIQGRQNERRRNEVEAFNKEMIELLKLYDEERQRVAPRAPAPPPPPEEPDQSDPDAPTRRWPTG